MSEKSDDIRYTDKCGTCGNPWVKRGRDFKVASVSVAFGGAQAVVTCACGSAWGMSAKLAKAL